jgi:hypothetical protein
MKNQLNTFQGTGQRYFISHAGMNEVDLAANLFDILTMASRQIVNHPNAGTAVGQRRRKVRTDEAGAAGDQG